MTPNPDHHQYPAQEIGQESLRTAPTTPAIFFTTRGVVTTMTAPAHDYHQESLAKVREWTGTAKYIMSFHVDETDLTNFWPLWYKCDFNAAKKPLHPELLYALLLHAKAKKWTRVTEVEG